MYIFLASNTNYIVFGLTWTGIRPIVFVIWCIHVNQYTIMAVWRNIVENLSKASVFYSHCCGVCVTHLYCCFLLLWWGINAFLKNGIYAFCSISVLRLFLLLLSVLLYVLYYNILWFLLFHTNPIVSIDWRSNNLQELYTSESEFIHYSRKCSTFHSFSLRQCNHFYGL